MIEINILLLWIIIIINSFLIFKIINNQIRNPIIDEKTLPPEAQALSLGEKIPSFSAITLDGNEISDLTLYSKKTIFIFFAPDCAPCKSAIPSYSELFTKAILSGWQMFLVSAGEEKATRALLEQNSVQIPTFLAPHESELLEKFSIKHFPSYYEVDLQGRIISSGFAGKNSSLSNLSKHW